MIHRLDQDTYAITRIGGERIATCHDRVDAMRKTGANVWICSEGASKIFGEVLCP